MIPFLAKHVQFGRLIIGLYQEPSRIGLSIIFDRGDPEFGERLLVYVKIIIWSIEVELI